MCCAFSASALLIRPDRDDAEYLELATRYASSVALNAPGGEGVLISPRWVLTSAHFGKVLKERKPAASLAFGARTHAIEAVYLHPDWKPGGPNDIALVFFKEPVQDIQPTPPYRGDDEAGKGVVIAGSGSATRDGNHDGIIGNAGDWEVCARVSAFAGWIEDTIWRAAQKEVEPMRGKRSP